MMSIQCSLQVQGAAHEVTLVISPGLKPPAK